MNYNSTPTKNVVTVSVFPDGGRKYQSCLVAWGLAAVEIAKNVFSIINIFSKK